MKRVLFILLLSISSQQAFSQVSFGVKGGGGITDIYIKNSDIGLDFESTEGYHFGIFSKFGLSDKWGIQAEFLYSKKGGDLERWHEDLRITGSKLSNLNLPIMAYYRLSDKFSLVLGPELSYLLTLKDVSGDNERSIRDFDRVRDIELGIAFGVEYSLANKVDIGARLSHGITEFHHFKWVNPFTGAVRASDKWINRSLQLYVNYAFIK